MTDTAAVSPIPGVRETVSQLPGAKVTTWAGFVFINPDPDAGPFEDYTGPDSPRNEELVAATARIAQKLGRRPARPDEVRELITTTQ